MEESKSFVEFTPSGKRVTHGGSGTGYSAYGCRCAECKAANTRRARERYLKRKTSEITAAHGLKSTYDNWGCRCQECKEAHHIYWAAYYRDNFNANPRPRNHGPVAPDLEEFTARFGRIPSQRSSDRAEKNLARRMYRALRKGDSDAIKIHSQYVSRKTNVDWNE